MVRTRQTLRLIALFKFAKAASLLVVAVVAFGLVHGPYFDRTAHWIRSLHLESGRFLLAKWALQLLTFKPGRFALIGAIATLYAAVFATEGWGLWSGKKWGEWLTVGLTSSLIPFEVWELFHRFSAWKLAGLAVNLAIVVYLWRVARRG